MGDHVNGKAFNVLAFGGTGLVAALSLLLVVLTLFG